MDFQKVLQCRKVMLSYALFLHRHCRESLSKLTSHHFYCVFEIQRIHDASIDSVASDTVVVRFLNHIIILLRFILVFSFQCDSRLIDSFSHPKPTSTVQCLSRCTFEGAKWPWMNSIGDITSFVTPHVRYFGAKSDWASRRLSIVFFHCAKIAPQSIVSRGMLER